MKVFFHSGILTGSVHATRRHGKEIENNIHLLRAACIEFEHSDFNPILNKFINDVQRTKKMIVPNIREEGNKAIIRVRNRINDTDVLQQTQQKLNNDSIELFQVCEVSFFKKKQSIDV